MCPLLLVFGTFTNILSLLVLARKRMRKHSTYLYLAILSVADMLVLYLGLIRDYLAHGYGIYINSTWLCKTHSFLFYFTLSFSSWILVAVSLDRFLAITFVFSSYTRQMLIKFLAKPKIICFSIGTGLCLINLHFFLFIKINTSHKYFTYNEDNSTDSTHVADKYLSIGVSTEYLYCVIDQNQHAAYSYFFTSIWPYIDLTLYAILPFCIMSICNISIIRSAKFSSTFMRGLKKPIKPHKPNCFKVSRGLVEYFKRSSSGANKLDIKMKFRKNKKKQSSMDNDSDCSKSSTSLGYSPRQQEQQAAVIMNAISLNCLNFHTRNIKMMTLTIILVTCIFIVLTLPIMLFIIFEKLDSASGTNHFMLIFVDPNCKAVLWAIVNIFMYMNHSINFVLYCLTGSKFRAELASIFMSPQLVIQATNDQQHSPNVLRHNTGALRYSGVPRSSYIPNTQQMLKSVSTRSTYLSVTNNSVYTNKARL